MKPATRVGEFDLIERIRRRARQGESVRIGIGDDAAVLRPTPGLDLVATTDSLVVDRHFTAAWSAADVGHLAMHVNLSDLAAMGAVPRWALLALTLPDDDPDWLEGFLDGFLAAARAHGVDLVGGNISGGPLNVGVQLLGEIAPDGIASRHGARVGDQLIVTGTLGDAAAALALGADAPWVLAERLRRPQARVGAGQVLAARARAMIDISDGLLADLTHLLAGGLGAEIWLDRLPGSAALAEHVADRRERWCYQAGGGNDYELLAALPSEAAEELENLADGAGVPVTRIGRIDDSGRLRCVDENGLTVDDLEPGWDHFR